MWRKLVADTRRFIQEEGLAGDNPLQQAVKLAMTPGYVAVATYRVGRFARDWRAPVAGQALRGAYFFWQRALEVTTGIAIHAEAEIGEGLYVHNHGQIYINGKIGKNATFVQGAQMVSASDGLDRGYATLGDDVFVGAGAKLVGPISIGSGAKIGVNAVVTRDVPSGATVATMPARVVKAGEETAAAAPAKTSDGRR